MIRSSGEKKKALYLVNLLPFCLTLVGSLSLAWLVGLDWLALSLNLMWHGLIYRRPTAQPDLQGCRVASCVNYF